MAKPDTIIIEGHPFSWQQVCAVRRQQLEAWQASQTKQLALFELKQDTRPKSECTASGRYEEPTMLDLMHISAGGQK